MFWQKVNPSIQAIHGHVFKCKYEIVWSKSRSRAISLSHVWVATVVHNMLLFCSLLHFMNSCFLSLKCCWGERAFRQIRTVCVFFLCHLLFKLLEFAWYGSTVAAESTLPRYRYQQHKLAFQIATAEPNKCMFICSIWMPASSCIQGSLGFAWVHPSCHSVKALGKSAVHRGAA